jgi:hypothetical protein
VDKFSIINISILAMVMSELLSYKFWLSMPSSELAIR